ncbi:leucine-rich repeat, cysteine-containing subtype protein [Tanacetum coccineum]
MKMEGSMESVLDCVLPYIHDGDDLISISSVSCKFYELDCITRKHLTVHLSYAKNPSTLSTRLPFIESLTLKGLPDRDVLTQISATPWIKEISKFECLKLKALHIRGLVVSGSRSRADLPVTSFSFLLPYVNQLRELNITSLKVSKEYCPCFLIERCPNLEVLRTNDVCGDLGLRVIGQVCKKLRKLIHLGRVTRMGLIALVQGCISLEVLDVNLSDISNEAIECVGTHLKNLRDFRMKLCKNGTDLPLDHGIRAMLKGCIKLKKLTLLLRDEELTDVGMGYIGMYGHNLRYSISVVKELTQYVTLAEKLHKLAVQLVADGSGLGSVKKTYTSSRATDNLDTPLVRAMLAKVEGMVKDGVPHLTKVGVLDVDVSLEGNIHTLIEQYDIMVIGVDEKPSKKALNKIDEISAVDEFVFLAFYYVKTNKDNEWISTGVGDDTYSGGGGDGVKGL